MNFRIRISSLEDVKFLTALFNSDKNVFGEDSTGFGDEDISEYVSDSRKKLFVAECEGEIIGALMADYHETYSHLETLIVAKPFQKNGVGSLLLSHYENDLERLKIPLVEVLTEQNNLVMQDILAKRGYRPGNTFVFYSKGE